MILPINAELALKRVLWYFWKWLIGHGIWLVKPVFFLSFIGEKENDDLMV